MALPTLVLRQSTRRRRWMSSSSAVMALLFIVLFFMLQSQPVNAITVPVDDIPLERPSLQIQSRKFTVDNRGYAHVPQDLSDGAEFISIPFRNVSQDPRNRRIIPVMTFYIPANGGQYYQAKLRPQDQQQQLAYDQQQQPLPPPHQYSHHPLKGHPGQHQQQHHSQLYNPNKQYSQQLSKPALHPIVNPSIGPIGGGGGVANGVLVPNSKPQAPASLSLAIANNYRTQYHQAPPQIAQHHQSKQQQFEVSNRRPAIPQFNALPPIYQPTKIPFQPHLQTPSPVQIFYSGGGGGSSSNGRPNSSSPKLNNQPYVIVSGGSGAGSSAESHHNHRKHPHPPSGQLLQQQANENQHHNLLTSPEVTHYAEPGKGITPFLPSNSVPGGFRPMIGSQKVSHVPVEVFKQYDYEAQGVENHPSEKYQFVSTTEKPLKYKYQPYQTQSVTTERPYYGDYPVDVQKQKFVPNVNEFEEEEHRQNYYSHFKAPNLPQAVVDESQFVTASPSPTQRPYIIASTTAKPRLQKPKFSSTYRAGGYLSVPDSAVTSTTRAPYKSVVPSFRKLKPTAFYAATSTAAPPPSHYYSTTSAGALALPPSGQHLTETTFANPTRISTYHPKINNLKAANPAEYYYLDQQHAVATTAAPLPPRAHHQHSSRYSLDDNQSLSQLLKKLQDSNHLPKTLTPNNIDNSIKTLIKILNNLKHSPNLAPDQHLQPSPPPSPDYNDNQDYYYDKVSATDPLIDEDAGNHVDEQLGANSGTPGVDYPNLFEIPPTEFNCKAQRYKGFFGDPETRCQVWHYCDLNGGQASFLCPNGTIFSQVALTCDWWFNVKCDTTAQLYVLNERLYKYILPFTPKFPEDYSGPLVDKYLALKFKEMEEKMRKQKGSRVNGEDEEGATAIESEEDNDDELGGISSIDQGIGISKMDGQSSPLTERIEVRPTTITPRTVPTTTQDNINDDFDQDVDLVEDVTGSNEVEVSKERLVQVTRVPRPPTKPIEQQLAPLVEINSDGSSGHLTPNFRLVGG